MPAHRKRRATRPSALRCELWGNAEVRPGVSTKDHWTVWVPYEGEAQDETAHGPARATGGNWSTLDDADWREYAKGVEERLQVTDPEDEPVRTLREIQKVTREVGNELRKQEDARRQEERGRQREAEDANNGAGAKTREEHLEHVARWQRLTDAAYAWNGRGGLSALGKDGEWLAHQECGKEYKRQTAGMTREHRKEVLEVVVRSGEWHCASLPAGSGRVG